MDNRDKVERLAIKWHQARFSGWYDAKYLAQVATLRTPGTAPQKTNVAQHTQLAPNRTFQVGDRIQTISQAAA